MFAAVPPPRKHRNRKAPSRWRWWWRLAAVALVLALVGTAWLDALVRQRFETHQWEIPSRVYSRPVELYSGRVLEDVHLRRTMELMRYRQQSGTPHPGTWDRVDGDWHIHTRGFRDTDGGEAPRVLVVRIEDGEIAALENRAGAPVAVARLEPLELGSIHPGHDEDRVLVRLEQVPPELVGMLLAVEDRRFAEHHGLSLRGMGRALVRNLRAGRIVEGGSTLTQQLVKNFWLTRDRTVARKLAEMPMAVLLELHYDKDEILETYLNEVYLGQDGRRAIHGMGLAARFHFGRPLEELETHQLAMLVGMLSGPAAHDPRRNPDRARARRDRVLEVAHREGVIDEAALAAALERPLDVVPTGESTLYAFPAFIDLVRRQLERDYPPSVLRAEGLQIQSTLDVPAQLATEEAVVREMERQDPLGERRLNAAAIVTAPEQGDVLALVGDRTRRSAGYNRALDAARPVGSLVKPAVVLTALQQSGQYHLGTPVADEPVEIPLENGDTWVPRNYDRRSLGEISMLEALTLSRNQATARLGMEIGPAAVARTLRELGVGRELPHYPSLLLGSVELTPFEVAVMYQTLASDGFRPPLRAITDVLDQDGEPLGRYPATLEPVADPDTVWLVQWAMQQVMDSGTARGTQLPGNPLVAGKTGTSGGNRDGWFAGFSESHLAVVWTGRDDNTPAGVSGSRSALPLWREIMGGLPLRGLSSAPPPGVKQVWLDGEGRRSAEGCEGARRFPLLEPSLPEDVSDCGRRHGVGEQERGGVRGWLRGWFD